MRRRGCILQACARFSLQPLQSAFPCPFRLFFGGVRFKFAAFRPKGQSALTRGFANMAPTFDELLGAVEDRTSSAQLTTLCIQV